MDFKVTGTREGVTALQMDIKIKGITAQIMREALEQAKRGRLHVLEAMARRCPRPARSSARAPRIVTVKIPSSKIGTVIGPGGKQIRELEALGVKIEVQEDGTIRLYSDDAAAAAEVKSRIEQLTASAEVGKEYDGVVAKVVDFGAFVTLFPGTDGLLHISQLAEERIERVEDVLQGGRSGAREGQHHRRPRQDRPRAARARGPDRPAPPAGGGPAARGDRGDRGPRDRGPQRRR
jgi:polyribonucleotide nucleotidyltransferase